MAKRITDEQMNVNISVNGGNEAKKKLGDLEQNYRGLKTEQEDLRKAKQRLIAEGKKESAEYKNIVADLKKNKVAMDENKDSQKAMRKEIGLTGLTMGQLKKEQKKLTAQIDHGTTRGTDDYKRLKKELQEVNDVIDQQRKDLRGTEEAMGDVTDVGGELIGAFGDIGQGLASGNIPMATAGLVVLRKSLIALTKSAIAFIATPIGATLAALAGIGLVTKKWLDYNIAIAESVKLTEQLTEFDGKRLSQYRAAVQATAETFDKDFNEVLRSANALAKQMKISQEDALDAITNGFVRGADASGDFLDKVREYPVQFKNAGFSAQDFIDIATQEATGGIYGDKLIDAIKEADLALKEFTKTQRDALENAFGETFTNEIANGLKSGEMTTKASLDRIIAKSNELGLNYQQQQQIVADLFKGAGEDAGGFAEIVLQLNEALEEENKILSENEEATQRLAESNVEYEQALADLFDASQSGFPAMLSNLKSIGTEISTNILTGLKQMFTSIEQLKIQAGLEGQSQAVKDIYENMQEFGTTAAEEAEIQMAASSENIKRLKKDIDDLGFFTLPGTKKALEEQLAEQESYYKELVAIAKGESEALAAYEESLKPNKDVIEDDNDEDPKPKGEKDNVQDEADKRAEREKEIREKVAEQLKEWERERAMEKEELELVKKEEEFEKLIEDAKGDRELIAGLEEEKQLQLQEIRDRYANERLEKEAQEKEKLRKLDEEFAAASAQATMDLERAKARAMQYGLGTLKSFFDEKSGIYKALFLLEKGAAIASVMNNSSKALAEITANTAAANAKAMAAAPLSLGQPWVMLNTAQGAKQALAVKLNTAVQIASIAGSAIQGVSGYEDGLYKDVTRTDGKRFRAKNMGQTKTQVVKGPSYFKDYIAGEAGPEMIIDNATFSQLDPQVVDHILNVRHNVRGFEDGMYPASQTSQTADAEMKAMMNAMMSYLQNPPRPVLQWGYEEAKKNKDLQQEIDQSYNNGKITS